MLLNILLAMRVVVDQAEIVPGFGTVDRHGKDWKPWCSPEAMKESHGHAVWITTTIKGNTNFIEPGQGGKNYSDFKAPTDTHFFLKYIILPSGFSVVRKIKFKLLKLAYGPLLIFGLFLGSLSPTPLYTRSSEN